MASARPTSSSKSKPKRGARNSRHVRPPLGLIGLDIGPPTKRLRLRAIVPIMLTVLFVALGFAALRTDLVRIRYALVEKMKQEQALLGEQRNLIAKMRARRDPVQLAEKARELGFVRPRQLIDLPSERPRQRAEAPTVLADLGTPAPAAHLDRR